MEKNYINWIGNTHFYVNLLDKTYGVKISVKDTPRASEIIKKVLEDRKNQIETWKKEWKVGVI